ncbi:MAG: 2-oxoacid ferredoxin oxidoreductase [Oligoflexia bacterium]|nr:2-oxoacid ferredoxin oxidoreductase [Oligoflexia bacterium]
MKEMKEITWCPGCGNFIILSAIDEAVKNLKIAKKDIVFVSGIGQAAKLPHFIQPCNGFASLHGRSIANAIGIKIANSKLKVLVSSGDGDLLAEGGNHLIHAIRRNISITCFLHDNQVYGLTKGQASPTMWPDQITKIQAEGIKSKPMDPLPMALTLGATFVARTCVTDKKQLVEIMEKAINHEGFSLVQILQTCPSFNKMRDVNWYKNNVEYLDEKYDKTNFENALLSSLTTKERKIKLGLFYENNRTPYEKQFSLLKEKTLVERTLDHKYNNEDLKKII